MTITDMCINMLIDSGAPTLLDFMSLKDASSFPEALLNHYEIPQEQFAYYLIEQAALEIAATIKALKGSESPEPSIQDHLFLAKPNGAEYSVLQSRILAFVLKATDRRVQLTKDGEKARYLKKRKEELRSSGSLARTFGLLFSPSDPRVQYGNEGSSALH